MTLLKKYGSLYNKFIVKCTLCGVEYQCKNIFNIRRHAIVNHSIHNFENLLLYFDGRFTLGHKFRLCIMCYSLYYKNMRHLPLEHKISGIYYCTLCDYISSNSRTFRFHIHSRPLEYVYWCVGCHTIIMTYTNIQSHLNKCCKNVVNCRRDYEIENEYPLANISKLATIEVEHKPYTFPGCDQKETPRASLPYQQPYIKQHNKKLYSQSCRLCTKCSSFGSTCKVCPVRYCVECKKCDPYLYTKGICMHCYMHAYSVWNDPVLMFTKGLFGVISGFTRPRNTTSPRNSRGLAMHGPYIAKVGAIVSEALALAMPLDRLNIPYGLERLVEATQYDDNGMPCFLADFGPYAFFAGSVIVPPLYLARDSPDPICRLEVTLLAGLNIGYPVAVVTLRAVKDFEVGRNKVREITIRRQCLTEYPWRGAAHLCLDPILAIPPQHRPTQLPPGTPCPNSAFSQYFAGKSPFGEPKESLIATQ